MWIERRNSIVADQFLPALALVGLRQVGKSSWLRRIAKERTYVSFDLPEVLDLAQNDPKLFFRQYPFPLVIDECQLAPEVFRPLKNQLDEWRLKNSNPIRSAHDCPVWLSGSNQFLVDKAIQESLAGRVQIRHMHPLSIHEVSEAGLSLGLQEIFLSGGWPELHRDPVSDPVQYVSNYLATAVEKDVVLFEGIEKVQEFRKALRLIAGRVGQISIVSEIARDLRSSPTTVSAWISGLLRLGILLELKPYHSNASKRLIKSPKLFYADVSLAMRLAGWSQVEPMLLSPASGSLFENLVFTELVRYSDSYALNWELYFFRTREGEELDFVVVGPNLQMVAIEAKLGGGDPLRAKLGQTALKLLGDVPLVLVGLESTERKWNNKVTSCSLSRIGPHISRLLGG
jgi:predicted AAA+ superfamily ATPase